jgi:enoyl-[acyl-carrier protein] reductase I
MGLMDGKVAVVFGVANKRSIAWGITTALAEAGAKIALNFQNERMREGVEKLAEELAPKPFVQVCDATNTAEVKAYMAAIKEKYGHIDALVHCIASAKREELSGNYFNTSWEGYALAQHVSAYSLVELAREAAPLMEGREGAILTLTYYGSEKVVPNYNVMGVAKAALESSVRYLANDLGPKGIRINAISAGPIKTLSAMGVADFSALLNAIAEKAPLRRNVTQEDVGHTALFLLSEWARSITGQVLYVDSGYCIMGA